MILFSQYFYTAWKHTFSEVGLSPLMTIESNGPNGAQWISGSNH